MIELFNLLSFDIIIPLLKIINQYKILIIIIIMTFIYKIIEYLSKKIDISSFHYEGFDDNGNDVKIVWFNADYKKGKYKNLYYRFKVDIKYFKNKKNPLKDHIIIINRNDILFFDKIKLLYFFIKEYIKSILCDKMNAKIDKILPVWFLNTYIFPNTIFI